MFCACCRFPLCLVAIGDEESVTLNILANKIIFTDANVPTIERQDAVPIHETTGTASSLFRRNKMGEQPRVKRIGMETRKSGARNTDSKNTSQDSSDNRKKMGWKKPLVIVLSVITLLVLCVFGVSTCYIKGLDDNLRGTDREAYDAMRQALVKDETDDTLTVDETKPFYALILGSDQRVEGEAARSDVMMLARVDAESGKVTLLSIPRDVKVDIEGYGANKVNAAYAFGGAALAIQTVEELAGVDITHCFELRFDTLKEAIDSIGGIDVNVPVSNDQTSSSNTGIEIDSGMQHMDGATALAFARERYGYLRGDFQRADNQRLIVMAVAKTLMSKPLYELPVAVESLARCVTTDMTSVELIVLANEMRNAGPLTIYSAIAPCDMAMIDGVSYDIMNDEAFAEMMRLMEAGEDPSSAEVGDSSHSTAASETIGE